MKVDTAVIDHSTQEKSQGRTIKYIVQCGPLQDWQKQPLRWVWLQGAKGLEAACVFSPSDQIQKKYKLILKPKEAIRKQAILLFQVF